MVLIKARKKSWLPKECPKCGKETKITGSRLSDVIGQLMMGYEPRYHHDRDPFKTYWWKAEKCGSCSLQDAILDPDPFMARLSKLSGGDWGANISLPLRMRQ